MPLTYKIIFLRIFLESQKQNKNIINLKTIDSAKIFELRIARNDSDFENDLFFNTF